MRLLVSADIHLGSPIRSVALRNPDLGARLRSASRDTFSRIVEMAIDEQVDALILAGDIFDNHHPDLKSRAFLLERLSRAAEAGVPTVLIRGNHDALLDHKAHGEPGPGIHLLHKGQASVEIGEVVFHGLSFDKSHVSKSFLPDYPAPVPGRINVGLMHTSLDGAPGHDPYAPCSERDLMAHGYDLWCLGHIHAPFERRDGSVLALMPGIPQPRHFGERTGGFVDLVTLGEGAPQVEKRPVGHLGFAALDVDLTDCSDTQSVLRRLREVLCAARDPARDMAVRLRVTSEHHGTAMVAELAGEVLESIEGVYLDKVKAAPPPQARDDDRNDDLLRLMRAEIAEPGFRQLASGVLEELRSALPSEISDELAEAAMDTLLEEALEEISLTLHGAEGDPE